MNYLWVIMIPFITFNHILINTLSKLFQCASNDIFVAGQFFEPTGAAGVEFVRADPDFRPQPELHREAVERPTPGPAADLTGQRQRPGADLDPEC